MLSGCDEPARHAIVRDFDANAEVGDAKVRATSDIVSKGRERARHRDQRPHIQALLESFDATAARRSVSQDPTLQRAAIPRYIDDHRLVRAGSEQAAERPKAGLPKKISLMKPRNVEESHLDGCR
jgi:hypothetical protein